MAVRIVLLLCFSLYGLTYRTEEAEASVTMLLLLALFIGVISLKELFSDWKKWAFLLLGTALACAILAIGGNAYFLLMYFMAYEALSYLKERFDVPPFWYFLPMILTLQPSPMEVLAKCLLLVLTMICYFQHDFIVQTYRRQTMEDTLLEQRLKKDMYQKEYETKAQLQRNMLKAENQILEDRASLSQTLHDKLGHGINGSIYQLEAIKLLMKKDPEKAQVMIQAVIDQLRVSMDEIRGILRKERPEKKELALLQLYKLCEDCNQKGVEATLETEGDASLVPEGAWEILLDNAFEAVTNAMKYAKCKKIEMKIVVMNQMIRCSISDDGKGCSEIKEGMGIAGMRRRVREAGGTISFDTYPGFTVNILLPF
ncbi:MAG: hypothetical protein J5721_04200 [Lachnospiraceae bacterium]|nr:hypothetical protein [Lachnospiraceae bacterium]